MAPPKAFRRLCSRPRREGEQAVSGGRRFRRPFCRHYRARRTGQGRMQAKGSCDRQRIAAPSQTDRPGYRRTELESLKTRAIPKGLQSFSPGLRGTSYPGNEIIMASSTLKELNRRLLLKRYEIEFDEGYVWD